MYITVLLWHTQLVRYLCILISQIFIQVLQECYMFIYYMYQGGDVDPESTFFDALL